MADQDHFSLSGPGLARIRAILDHSGDFLEHFWSTILYYQAREAPGVSGFPVSYQACGREAPSTHPESLYPRLFGCRLARSKNFWTIPAPLGPGLTSSEHLFFRAQFVLKGIFSGPADDAQEQALRNRYSHSATRLTICMYILFCKTQIGTQLWAICASRDQVLPIPNIFGTHLYWNGF